MATFVLGTIGRVYGGAVGQVAGSALGAYIDQRYLWPALFPERDGPPQEGNRLSEFPYQGADEGSPLNYGIGPWCRSTGTVIYLGDIIESGGKKTQGGKGGGGMHPGTPPAYIYRRDVGITFNYGREISGLRAILADGKQLYLKDWEITETKPAGKISGFVSNGINGSYFVWQTNEGGADLHKFKVGEDITFSGSINAANKGPFQVTLVNTNTYDGNTYMFLYSAAIVTEVTTSVEVGLSQELDEFFGHQMTSIDIYLGEDPQTPNTDMETAVGANYNPGYNKSAYVFLKGLNLTNFTNRLPQFQFIFKCDNTIDVDGAVDLLCDRGGLATAEYDTSGVIADQEFHALLMRGPTAPAQPLQAICAAYDLVTQYSNGVLKFTSRENLDTIELDADFLGARTAGTAPTEIVTVDDSPDEDLPSEFEVGYFNIHNNMEKKMEVARLSIGSDQRVDRINTELGMCRAQALAIAHRLGWIENAHREMVSFSLPPSQMALEEGDIVEFTAPHRVDADTTLDVDYRLLVTKRERGENGLILYQGVTEHVSTMTWEWDDTEEDDPIPGGGDKGYYPPPLELYFLDIGGLRDDDVKRTGVYFGVSVPSRDVEFGGCSIMESQDGGTTYEEITQIAKPVVAGMCLDVLGEPSSPGWDLENTVTVFMRNGELESVTEDEALAGRNRAAIKTTNGWEIIGFVDATLVQTFPEYGTYVYELSTLLRGLHSTDDEMGDHAVRDDFVYLNDQDLVFIPFNDRSYEEERYFKAVSSGMDEDDVTGTAYTFELNSNRPWSPCEIAADRDGSNHVTFTYTRRSRAITTIFGTSDVPELEPHEKYEVDVWDDVSHTTLMRTIEIILDGQTQPSYHYSATDQSTDGYTPGDDLYITMYQVSIATGRRSKGKDATV